MPINIIAPVLLVRVTVVPPLNADKRRLIKLHIALGKEKRAPGLAGGAFGFFRPNYSAGVDALPFLIGAQMRLLVR